MRDFKVLVFGYTQFLHSISISMRIHIPERFTGFRIVHNLEKRKIKKFKKIKKSNHLCQDVSWELSSCSMFQAESRSQFHSLCWDSAESPQTKAWSSLFCQQPQTWTAPQTHSQPWQLSIDFSNNTSSNSHDPSPVLHTNNSHRHTQVTTPLYSHSNCSSNTKCFLLPSVYDWAESLQLSGKMGIK